MAAKEYKTLNDLLTTATVDDIFTARGKVIEIDVKDTAEHSFQVLVDNHILSAPVYDNEKRKYIGFIDMNDFVTFIVQVYKEKKEGIEKEDFRKLLSQKRHFFTETVNRISDISKIDPFRSLASGRPLLEAVRLLASGIHRVPIIKDGRVINVLSQSAVVNWIAKNVDHVKNDPKLFKTVGELRLGLTQVVSLPQYAKVIEALTVLHEQKMSAVALHAENGTLLGVFSNYDIKAFFKNPSFPDLVQKTALQFLSANRQTEIEARSTVIDTSVDTSFINVIKKLAVTQVHRLYITKDLKPLGVISLTDILHEVISS